MKKNIPYFLLSLLLYFIPSSMRGEGGILRNIQYGQENPYNLLCPVMSAKVYQGSDDCRAHTGCVATAMSQLMRYWEWPVQPTGRCTYQSVDSYNKEGKNIFNIDNNLDAHKYDWSLILEDYHGCTDSTQMRAVAQLMFDAGSSVQMQYTSYTSDAGHINAAKALTEHFGYFREGMQTYSRNTTSDSLWRKVIREEITASRPVLIEGFGSSGGFGHEYLLDGYDESTNKVHVNFGFENTGGWYPLYEHYTYTANFGICIGIRPNREGAAQGSFQPNIHRLNDMQYADKSIKYRLRNDGLGVATADSKIYTSLAVVRDGKIIGLCASSDDASVYQKPVLLNCSHDDGFNFNPLLPLSTFSTLSTLSTLTPSEVAIRNLSTDPAYINADDILVPLLSVDGGSTWQLADGNETHINSLRVTLDPTPEPVSYTYSITLHGAPFTPGGVNPYIIYNDDYGEAYCYDDFITMPAELKSSDLKAKSATGYVYKIWIRHSGDDHEIHVTYSQNPQLTTYSLTELPSAKVFYNILDKDGNILYYQNGEVLSSPAIDLNSASAAWAIGNTSTAFSQKVPYYFYNYASPGFLYAEDGLLKVGSTTGNERRFFFTQSLDTDYWLLQNSSSSSGAFLQLNSEATAAQILSSQEALWGIGGTETSAIKLSDDSYGLNSTKLQLKKIEGTITAIDTIPSPSPLGEGRGEASEEAQAETYTLSGQRVNKLAPGIYIQHGRKIINVPLK